MNVIVCVKQVPYPDTPASAYSIDTEAKKISLPEGTPFVISPFDENAVEIGLQIKDQVGGKLTVISLATNPADEVVRDLRQTLAMGADEAVLLDDPSFTGGDSYATAYCLAMAIKKIGDYDLILCGRQAADWDAGQVGIGISELLEIPAVTPVVKVKQDNNQIQVERIIENGYEVLELPLPSVISVSSDETTTPRIAPLPGVIKARKRKIPIWTAADIDADMSCVGESGSKLHLEALEIPQHEGECEFISGDSEEDTVNKLAEKLRMEKLI